MRDRASIEATIRYPAVPRQRLPSTSGRVSSLYLPANDHWRLIEFLEVEFNPGLQFVGQGTRVPRSRVFGDPADGDIKCLPIITAKHRISPARNRCSFSLARGRHDPFEVLEPAEDNCKLGRPGSGLCLPNHNETAAIRRWCVIVEAVEVRSFEEYMRLARLKTGLGFDRHR